MAFGPWGFESPLSHRDDEALAWRSRAAFRRAREGPALTRVDSPHGASATTSLTDTDTTPPTPQTPDSGPFEIAVEEDAAWKRKLTITVAPEHVAATRRRESKKLARKVRIKGFRTGKVPPRVIEERYGPAIDERALTALMNEGFQTAVRTHALNTIGEPAVGQVRYDPGESLTFQVEVEIMPEVRLGRTGGFRIKRPTTAFDEREVGQLIDGMRADHAVLEPVERSPEDGDVVSVRIRTEEEDDGAEPYRFELGAGYAIPDVEQAIRSLEPGGSGEFDITYPDDFSDTELAGTTKRVQVELIDVKAKRLPELDDDFAREISEFDTLEALREAVTVDLERHREREADEAVRERLIDSLIEANAFEVPPSLVARYLDRVIEAPEDADPEQVESARETLAPAIERQIKKDLILDRLIESEGLAASDEEVEERVAALAENSGLTPAEARKRLAREKSLDSLRRRIALDKAFDLLLSQSTIE